MAQEEAFGPIEDEGVANAQGVWAEEVALLEDEAEEDDNI